MDSTSTSSTTPIGVNPRHLGLTRRQSYDTPKGSLGLSLGKLPPPTFGNIPLGLRSVPAVESSRHFGSAFRNHVTTPNGDGQRTPGGSLVIGAEVFGFGAALKKEPRERWGTGSIESAGLKTEEKSDWPSEFETAAVANSKAKHGTSSLSAVSSSFPSSSSRSSPFLPCHSNFPLVLFFPPTTAVEVTSTRWGHSRKNQLTSLSFFFLGPFFVLAPLLRNHDHRFTSSPTILSFPFPSFPL